MNASKKGRDYENAFKRRLYERGAQLVVRAAASKGPFDLLAVFPDTVIGYQLKGFRSSCESAIRAMLELPDAWNCTPKFVHKSKELEYCEH